MLSPTRELALLAYEHLSALSQFTNIKSYACVGGTNVRVHIEKLKEGGVQVIVGTPGRIHDLIQRGVLSVEHVKVFCFDEIDELLAREFGDSIEEGEAQLGTFRERFPDNYTQYSNPSILTYKSSR